MRITTRVKCIDCRQYLRREGTTKFDASGSAACPVTGGMHIAKGGPFAAPEITEHDLLLAFFRAEYGDSVSDDLIVEIIADDLNADQRAAIVDSVLDQPHLIER